MRVYIASALPNLPAARAWADALRAAGHEVTSTWHESEANTVKREGSLSVDEQAEIARGCLCEVRQSQAMIWLHGNANGRVGAAVELGYAQCLAWLDITPFTVYSHSLDGHPAPSVFGSLCEPVADVNDLIRRMPPPIPPRVDPIDIAAP